MEQKTNKKKELILGLIILILAVGVFALFQSGIFNKKNDSAEGKISVSVEVINENEDYEKVYDYQTEEKTLGELLDKEGLIEAKDSEYGRYIIGVDDMKADDAKEQWWCVLVNGESAQTGVDGIELEDNAKYTLEMKTGY